MQNLDRSMQACQIAAAGDMFIVTISLCHIGEIDWEKLNITVRRVKQVDAFADSIVEQLLQLPIHGLIISPMTSTML